MNAHRMATDAASLVPFSGAALQVYAQPIRFVSEPRPTGGRGPWFEILLRGPFASPEAFVLTHYAAGNAVALDTAVFELAVPKFRSGAHYSINVALESLASEDFIAPVLDLLHRHRVASECVVLELVSRDGASSTTWHRAIETITFLSRHFGVQTALDDILPLEEFALYEPFRYVKFSTEMTAALLQGNVSHSISALLEYASETRDLDLVAEGIETAQALEGLRTRLPLVTYWQGFHDDGRPAPLRPSADDVVRRRV